MADQDGKTDRQKCWFWTKSGLVQKGNMHSWRIIITLFISNSHVAVLMNHLNNFKSQRINQTVEELHS